MSEEITIKLPPGAIKEIEEITKDWKSDGGHTADTLPIQVQWLIMNTLNKYRKGEIT
jgi:hypothetical protein